MNRSLYRRLLRYMRPYWWPHFTIAIVCMLLFSATNGALPFLIRFIFDDVFTNKNIEVLRILPLAIIGVFVARGIVSFGSTYLSEYVGQRIVADMRTELNDHIQHLSLSFFNRTATGTIVSRVTNDVAMVRGAVVDALATVLKDASSLLASSGSPSIKTGCCR